MARERRERGGGSFGRLMAGLALVSVGVCLGIILGSLVDGPRLFVRRLTEPVQRIELPPAVEPIGPEELTAFRALQTRPREKRVATPPAQRSAPTPERTQATAPPPGPSGPAPVGRALAPRRLPDTPEQRAAERVIAELRSQQLSRRAVGSGKVVQVAAYTDRRSAEALANRLEVKGFSAYVSRTEVKGRDRYRVRVKPRPGLEITALTSRLEAEGLSIWVTRE